MKYVRIEAANGPRWGNVCGETVYTLNAAPYEGGTCDGGCYPLSACKLLPPCQPTKIVCVGKNYADHAREMGAEPPGFPVLFLKGCNTLNCPDGPVASPDFVNRLDYEGELAVVIGKKAKRVKADDFADYVFGYTCLNDVTARDIQQHDGQWTRGKSMDGFCPIGPWVMDDIDPAALSLETRVNGISVQRGNTADFITAVPELIEFITASMTLEPGDVVATGTPAGIGELHSGDVVEVEIQGIGILRNTVK